MAVDVKPKRASRAAKLREWRARKAVERSEGGLMPFQSAFVAAVSRKRSPLGCSPCRYRGEMESRGCAAVWWREV